MANRNLAALFAVSIMAAGSAFGPALAENQMGYRLLSAQEAAALPRNHGAFGLDVERSQQITDADMTFDIMRVKQVRSGSPGAQAGFHSGDQIIAVDGRVFTTIAAFGAYVRSISPGTQASVDYIPTGGGPAQAQRVSVTVAAPGRSAQPSTRSSGGTASPGLSTGTKVAIGVGAAALLGCYELGCFSHRGSAKGPASSAKPAQQ